MPVAIIGVGLRLPGADSLDAFWGHLSSGRSLINEVPARRWNADELRGNPAKENKTNSVWGGFLEDADAFDAAFFNVSPREASWMDPQQRFALEMAWHAIEDAGLRAHSLAGSRTGVYMGVCHWDYAELIEKHLERLDAYTPTGIAFSVIANRVSHFFDLRGPSVTNDTACAASLVSIYEAVRALQNGECDLALAGGVNLAWSPNHFIAFAKSGMLSKDGKAKAFDARADGYVRGEGGAMLLLKPLARAQEDGDPIHAVISGIGTNHGGHTSSLTVTNPTAQADLIAEVHGRAGVAPDEISYVEAHGPGTPLGDPIEISGLKAAFRKRASDTGVVLQEGSCGIGSVKTNIGHLEGAAGVAGIAKVLAALRYDALPPNVGFETLNPLIDLSGTPFRIQSRLTPWPRRDGKPRRAGISSFGFGGTNAHAVIEDAPLVPEAERSSHGPLVVPISAKSDTALRRSAEVLIDFLDRQPGLNLVDLALTFQAGREEMDRRVAFVVESVADLRDASIAYVAGEPDTRVRLQGAGAAEAEPWRSADVWAGGGDVVFTAPSGAQRIHAPLYPFERERHWIDTATGIKDARAVPHPLLHRNCSSFEGVAYRTRWTGSEFYFADHQVQGAQILPGVVALEMARAAYVLGARSEGPLRLCDLVWSRAIAAGDTPVEVELRLARSEEGGAEFTVSALDRGAPGPICVQGRVAEGDAGVAVHDLAQLRAGAARATDVQVCYERLRSSGVVHGPAFQALSAVRRGDGYVLAELRLPRRLAASLSDMPLHPVLLDAAIQAWVALDDEAPSGAGVPFACREVQVHGRCEAAMTAYVRPSGRVAHGLRYLDIDLCDKSGRVCVAFKELALRLVSEGAQIAAEAQPGIARTDRDLVLAKGEWAQTAALFTTSERATTVFLTGALGGLKDALAAQSAFDVRTLSDSDARDSARMAGNWFHTIHAHVANLVGLSPKGHQRILVIVPDAVPAFVAAPLVGLLKTASLEHPRISGAVIQVLGACDAERLRQIAELEATAAGSPAEIRHDGDGRRFVWRPVKVSGPVPATLPPQLDSDGVYWITGGLGGLGLIFADALVARGARHIVLSGRRDAPDAKGLARLAALRTRGVDVRYMPCDVSDRTAVDRLVASIGREIGALEGVIHAAGLLNDAYIFGTDAARIDPVLAPKVAGTLNIDAATADLGLSFLVLCSSVASAFGNAGQASYAGANAFLDAFAEHRDARVARGERRGATRAIAWPLWAEGGMTVDGPFLEGLRRRFGTEPLPTAVGIDALWQALSCGDAPRAVVLYGDRTRIETLLAETAVVQAATPAESAPDAKDIDTGLLERTVAHLKELLSEATQIEPARIRDDAPLIEYGLDSIIIVDVTARLERIVGPLSKTLFFEHVTLASLAAHLVEEHGAALTRALPLPSAAMPASEPAGDAGVRQHVRNVVSSSETPNDTHDVAIIGLSLRVAKAANQDAFWKMLANGEHSVGPVPQERWDHSAIYHSERDVLGKTVVKSGAFLDDIDKFDPRYFRISQAEAELMSPEVRLFLEASVEAFEDAGYSRETLQQKFGGDVAVLVGSMTNEYDYYGFQNMLVRGTRASGSYTGTVPNMVSYFYGLTGPSYFLDTMCSASSTCIHEAVHMLRSGRCQMALAGGVSLLLHPQKLIAVSQEHFTSKTAEVVRGYGVGADGTILGEGVGALVLKRTADAERDGDHIYGVIKGTAVTNAGVRNGFTVPSPAQQAAAVTKALEDAGIDPRTIGYVEGHGSGTALGDPIEIRALTQAYRAHTHDTQFCALGTVKSNVAHLLAAAGTAGVAKVLMQLKHGQLAPSLHAETLNPDIPFATTPFRVQRDLAPWTRMRDLQGRELPRRAGVTSIGAGGMNSHLIVEEYIGVPRALHSGSLEVAVFSAMNPAALARVVKRMRDHVVAHPDLALGDIAYTLQVGRTALPCRLAVVARSPEDLVRKLDAFVAEPSATADVWYTPSTLDREQRADAARVKADTIGPALDRIASYWADGVAIDWDVLHSGRRPNRVSLPTYPFERVRCWYPEFDDAPSVIQPLGARGGARPSQGSFAAVPAISPLPASASDADVDAALRDELTSLAGELLKFDAAQIDPRASFYDLGFDSISLTRFAALIGERFGVTVSPAIFFDCGHVDALSRHLAGRGAGAARTHEKRHALAPRASMSFGADRDEACTKVAIVGIACRLPGADSPDIFVDRLLAGADLTTEFPLHRYGADYAKRIECASFAKRGGFLADVDRFDAAFFRISPVEAERMDPQQRLLLETTWRALESGGYRPEDLPRDTGVFVGVSGRDYASLLEAHGVPHDGFAATGNSLAMVANRISYQLNLNGPSEAIDTACSSSLVALVRGAEAVALGRCTTALVGGVNLALSVEGFEGPHLAGMLSPEGRCKTFSANADGYARGEGVVALLLKPLAQAEADGDNIFGVLIGSAVNHGGRAGALTAPNAKAQADLVARAMAEIDPASIGYIETHGTGTALGDPVEIAALTLAYSRMGGQKPLPTIALGAVKSNIGHLEAAAGLAGVVKVLGAMQRGEIPPTLHCADINPHIELSGSPFFIGRDRAPWPRRLDSAGREFPRRAGVSSFGFGGVNAHVVLEAYPGGAQRRTPLSPRAFADTRFWIPGVETVAPPADETVLLAPQWTEAPLSRSLASASHRRIILSCGVAVANRPSARVIDCDLGAGHIGVRYAAAAGAALDALQEEMRRADVSPVLVQLVHSISGGDALFSGLGALLDTASAEYPSLSVQVIGVSASLAPELVADLLDEEARHPHHRRVRRDAGSRRVRTWVPLSRPRLEAPVWCDGGVYLIAGGMGGIGRLLARDIAARAKAPVLILVGRSPFDSEHARVLDALRAAGADVCYHAVDIADRAAIASLIDGIIARHGRLNSVLHCAGTLRDRTLLNKTRDDLAAVLAPKVLGTLALAEACRGRGLDSFVLFSSLAGAVGNAGQADYAAANGFLDAIASARYGDLPVISVNWPLWRDGGMQISEAGRARLFETMAQRPLATEAGLSALGAAQSSGVRQIAVVAGEGSRIRSFFEKAGTNRAIAAPLPQTRVLVSQGLVERVSDALRHLLARVSGVAAGRIEAGTPLDEYGIDSLMITRLNRELGDVFGPLSGTLLFEHRTLGSLARHLAIQHPDGSRKLVGEDARPLAQSTQRGQASYDVSVQDRGPVPGGREPIAIIGISGRFPGAEDLDTFWENLAAGRDLITEIPSERWPMDGFFEPDIEAAVAGGKSYAKWGGFLDDFAGFDPLFFKISPRDAAAMDPQERLFLMVAWAACEDAGYSRSRLAARCGARVGVFAGVTKTGFALHGAFVSDSGALVRPTTSFASIANRVSHVMDLNGPSLPIDTMCSSSLTALHEACEALYAGTCAMALAGGVNLYLHPSNFVELSAARMLSPEGRCKSFGEGADGFVPGEGVGCVLLKPLSRAVADGDRIHAVIRGTAVNHGGRTNGYTVPNPLAQRDVIRAALHAAALEARAVTCIEAHGTGTDLGDPIEVAALTQAFEVDTPDRTFCALGSVKSNIGHLEAAAGIAGLTKVILQMKHGFIAPTCHADVPNPKIDFGATPFKLASELAPWEAETRIAGISSFGAGGANAHVIVEEWRPSSTDDDASRDRDRPHAIVLSARDPERLCVAAQRLLAVIEKSLAADVDGRVALRDIAFTLQVGREAMDERLAFEAVTFESAAATLRAFVAEQADYPGLYVGNARDHRAVMSALAADDEDVRALARNWVIRGSVGRLLALWVQGLPVDWEDLPRSGPAQIVSLPSYPFARDRYWLPDVKAPTRFVPEARERVEPRSDTARLLADAETLETAIAPLVRSIVRDLPDGALSQPFDRWRGALGTLLPNGASVTQAEAWAAWDTFKAKASPTLSAQITLAETALRALPDILAGRRTAASVLFPAGRLDLVEAVYKDNPVARRFSAELARHAADAVRAKLAAQPEQTLRILEIGAGTGGTSEPLFDVLGAFGGAIAEYRFTDVSRAFLIKAEQRFSAQVPALATSLFDVEKPPAEQGIATGRYDLVVAANVLHATADIRRTLRHVRETLAPGGVLLLNETSRATLFTHVTFGLLEGWWRFIDGNLRIPGTPSLSAARWRAELEAAGFTWETCSPDEERALGQQIIVARAPEQEASLNAGAASSTLREILRRAVAETLNMSVASVAPERPFADYGLDSILGAELVERIKGALGVRIEQTRLYDFGSVARLEGYIAQTFQDVSVREANSAVEAAQSVSAPAVVVAKAATSEVPGREPIAIVGMSGRFAQSPDVEALWEHLQAGRNLVEPVTRFSTARPHFGSFIEGIDRFDPVFFGISGVEATYMDPQQRLFLEEAWKALEHAGHAGSAIEGRRCGVFVGCSAGDYQELFRSQPPGQAFWGNTSSLIPARIAYCLDLKGPAIAVDTACSSSLVALDLACRSLWSGESELAIAGGVFVQCTDRFFRYADAAGMLSPSGRCAAFGADADGIVPGEAVAAVVLRPLSAALADGDSIHGLIAASGTNQDGATNGITAPSGVSQQRLMREVYDTFGIDPRSIGFVEAHGTGTRLGDPIEYDALADVFSSAGVGHGACLLGSVKSNLGHATTAAGITSLIKVLGALKTGLVPPTLHVGSGNPAIQFTEGPFRVNATSEPWPSRDRPCRAVISSFGFSGTNAHVVVEEPQVQNVTSDRAAQHLIVLSARTADQLRLQAERLVRALTSSDRPTLRDVAFTLLAGRRHLAHRLAVVAQSVEDLASRLSKWLASSSDSGVEISVVDAGARTAAWDAVSDDPVKLADAFLKGAIPDAERLFAGTGRRRVPLPTYPFAAGRYWVDESRLPELVVASAPSSPAKLGVAAASVRRVLDTVAAASVESIPSAPGKIRLAPLQPAQPVPERMIRIGREVDGAGVCKLMPEEPWSSALEAALVREFRDLSQNEAVRAIVLSVSAAWGGDPAAQDVAAFTRAALDCSVPVVAAIAQSCAGAGFVAALSCDFVVLSDAARVTARGADISEIVRRRINADLAKSLLRLGQEQSGKDLRQAGLVLRVVPHDHVIEDALALANTIARAPRHALVELKRHMRGAPLCPGAAAPAREPLRVLATGGGEAFEGGSRRIELAAAAVALDVFDDGVAVLRMEERSGRNTFTADLMDGLSEAFEVVARSSDIKAVVLTGFEGYFACGGTADGLESLQRGDTHFTDRRIYSLPLECPLPVIAAMQGHAIGAGWALGMFCDLALFGAESVYHSNYLELGFTPGAGATLIFPRRLGDDLGREVLFSAMPFKGRDLKARAPGLHVLPGARVLPEALRLAHTLARRTRDELIAAKSDSVHELLEALPGVLQRELDMHRRTFIGNDEVLTRIRAAFPSASDVRPQTAQSSPQSDRLALVRAAVVESLAEELMINAADIRDGSGFLDLGLDSILAVTWIRRLNARFGIELPATAVYAQPTVGALAARIADLMPREADIQPREPVAVVSSPEVAPSSMAVADEGTRAQVRDRVVRSLAEELMIDAAEIRDGSGFLDLGLDSILAVTWIRRLNAAFGTELPATAVYANPTVGALVDRLAKEANSSGEPPAPPTTAVPESVAAPTVEPAPSPAIDAVQRPPVTQTAAIAVIGMSGRYPQAENLEAFWDNIEAGRDCITEVPPERWDLETHYDPDPQAPGKSYCKWMGAIDGVDRFDSDFFNITPREAELMDPQQRLFLQHAWHAIEDAGIDPTSLAGTACGVFVGGGPSGYADLIEERNAYSLLGAAGSILAARIAYLLDLTGSAVSLDTACSSSLVALAEACNSLVLGNSDLALAGGACVLIGPSMFVDTSKVNMLSKDGRCFTFDERANGFVPGEGVGVMLLKRLDDAVRDGDPIRAVIRGWGVNQDGKTNGIAAPNPQAQARLIRGIHDRFGIAPDSIGLIECHGTGTTLGDPIEIEGLAGAFAGRGLPNASCAIGSVKSNVGHLLASAGVAGAMKAVFALEKAILPPTLHVVQQNPHLAIAGTPFFINTAARPWDTPANGLRRAGVSAFGFSGTNAHLVLESAPVVEVTTVAGGPWMLPVSARSVDGISAYAAEIRRFVETHPGLDLASLAATFQRGRTAFAVRRAMVFRDRAGLLRALEALASDPNAAVATSGGPLDVLTRRWLAGDTVSWPETTARRIQAPGYPFAEERCWVTPERDEQEPAIAPSFTLEDTRPGRFLVRIETDDAHVSTLLNDGLGGLLLPEIVREAGQRGMGRAVLGLKHLVWAPLADGGRLSSLAVAIGSDEDGFIFDVTDGRRVDQPCHLGAFMLDDVDACAAAWPAPVDERRFREDGRDVTARWARFAGAGNGGLAVSAVVSVGRLGEDLVAHLKADSPLTETAVLHLIWRLIAFSEMNGHAPAPTVPFAAERLIVRTPMPSELWVRITHEDGAVTVAGHGVSGAPVLLIDGLISREAKDMMEIDVQGEILQ